MPASCWCENILLAIRLSNAIIYWLVREMILGRSSRPEKLSVSRE